MTLATVVIAGVPTLALMGIELNGKLRQWKEPLIVSLEILEARPGLGPAASIYVLSVPRLDLRADPGSSIVEAVRLLQAKIIAAVPPVTLEALLEKG
jgi:hypothetical protein